MYIKIYSRELYIDLSVIKCTFYVMVEKVLFFGQIFEMEILVDLHVMRIPESEKHIFSFWSVCVCVCVCLCVCLCVSYQHNSKTNYSRNIKFSLLHLYHVQMLLETIYKDRTKTLWTGAHKRILIHYGLWTVFHVSEFSYI